MRTSPLLFAALLVVPLAAADAVERIPPAEAGASFIALPSRIVFVDADGDGSHDAVQPNEPVYLDAHNDGVLNNGDVRLSDAFGFPEGTAVQLGDPDFGAAVRVSAGWFAVTRQGAWYVDLQPDRSVSHGDVRLTGPSAGSTVIDADADVGEGLPAIQTTIDANRRIGWTDPDGDGRVDVDEHVYLDLDDPRIGAQTLAAGDLRIFNHAPSPSTEDTEDAGDAEADDARPAAPAGMDWALVIAVVDLAAIVGLAAVVLRRPKA